MQVRPLFVRKIIALFVTAILVLAVEPGALAMPPVHHSAPMQMMDCAHMAMAPSHAMQEKSTPCNHMASCLGMLNCLAMAVVPVNAGTALPLASVYSPSWHLNGAGPGITHQPDNPPPIA